MSRFEVAREFYRKPLPEFGMKTVFDGDSSYCVGARTAIGIEPASLPWPASVLCSNGGPATSLPARPFADDVDGALFFSRR